MNQKYEKKDVLMWPSEAFAHRCEFGWFADSRSEVLRLANSNAPVDQMFFSECSIRPFRSGTNEVCYGFFIPQRKPSYNMQMLSWIEKNKVNRLTYLRVTKLPSDAIKKDCPYGSYRDDIVGKVYQFYDVEMGCIRVRRHLDESKYDDTLWALPYVCFEVAESPKFEIGGWVKHRNEKGFHKIARINDNLLEFEDGCVSEAEDCIKIHFEAYDLNNEQIRRKLRDKWILSNNGLFEFRISCFKRLVSGWFAHNFSSERLVKNFHFDNGYPVGTVVFDE